MHNLNWDDLKFVLTVADTGSVSAAARALSVNHATVLRRVASFEDKCGGPVFERSASGYRLRPERANVIEAAREAAGHFDTIEALMRGQPLDSATTLRLTSTDSLCQTTLARELPRIARANHPHNVVLVSSNSHLDMARLQADVALRPTLALPKDMSGQELCDMHFAVYEPQHLRGQQKWLALFGALANSLPAQWMAANIDPGDIGNGADSFCVLREMAAGGAGRAILPCFLGDEDNRLTRVDAGLPDMRVPLWVACHRDLIKSDRIKTMMTSIERAALRHKAAFMGATASAM